MKLKTKKMALECLDGIVGISSSPCVCLESEGNTFDYQASSSGIYMDELMSACLVYNKDCNDRKPYDIMISALGVAKTFVANSIVSTLGSANLITTRNELAFNKRVGESTTLGALPNNIPFVFSLPTKNRIGATLVIKSIAIKTDTAGTTLVTILKDGQPFLEINSIMNSTGQAVNLTPHAKLPIDGSLYTISYNPSGSFIAFQNEFGCNCGGIKNMFLTNYLNYTEIEVNTLLNQWNLGGMSMDWEVECELASVSCLLAKNGMFTALIGQLIASRAVETILGKLSHEVNVFNIIKGADLGLYSQYHHKAYVDSLGALVKLYSAQIDKVDLSLSCAKCTSYASYGRLTL